MGFKNILQARLIPQGTTRSNAVRAHGITLPQPDDAGGANRQIANITDTQTAAQAAVTRANILSGSRNAPAPT